MKYSITYNLNDGATITLITQDYPDYSYIERAYTNGLYCIGFKKEGASRRTWIPYKAGRRYSHNVRWIEIKDDCGSVVERIEGIQ